MIPFYIKWAIIAFIVVIFAGYMMYGFYGFIYYVVKGIRVFWEKCKNLTV